MNLGMPVLINVDGPYFPMEEPSSTNETIYGFVSASSLNPTIQREPAVGATCWTP